MVEVSQLIETLRNVGNSVLGHVIKINSSRLFGLVESFFVLHWEKKASGSVG